MSFARLVIPRTLVRTWGTPQGFLESWREPEEETADLSTALRSGRDDKVVRVLELIFHGKGAVASPQLHCASVRF
jgi:hypothetical protein